MIRIMQLKLAIKHTQDELRHAIIRKLCIASSDLLTFEIVRQSIDARRKPDVFYLYTVDVTVLNEQKVLKTYQKKHKSDPNVAFVQKSAYKLPLPGDKALKQRPVICGSGPAGLFCAYYLACKGYAPIVLERGKDVDGRKKDIDTFWETGVLVPDSNVQFGEGGAGTFSDGKLNTLVKDKTGRIYEVLRLFVEMGAKERIRYEQKPHLGTDKLVEIIRNLRQEIIRLGGSFRFETLLTDVIVENNVLKAVKLEDGTTIGTDLLVLAIGHSARDTIQMLYERGLMMSPKSFAVGYRVQHKQALINQSQYGAAAAILPPAPYKLTARAEDGRGVYSFCMCPGGYVVNASSEPEKLCVNGMSYSDRGSQNANSAIIVSVTPADYPSGDALAGIAFQRQLEQKAYAVCGGKIPIQRLCDYKNDTPSTACGTITPVCKGAYAYTNLRGILPKALEQDFVEGMEQMNRKIPGFAADDVLLCGVESRTSSPVRMERDERCLSNIGGIYPCGEGAGYAGGITSAAADGILIAEKIIQTYHTDYEG